MGVAVGARCVAQAIAECPHIYVEEQGDKRNLLTQPDVSRLRKQFIPTMIIEFGPRLIAERINAWVGKPTAIASTPILSSRRTSRSDRSHAKSFRCR
jgi:hypothetical protein